jgi:hypothetical protein
MKLFKLTNGTVTIYQLGADLARAIHFARLSGLRGNIREAK